MTHHVDSCGGTITFHLEPGEYDLSFPVAPTSLGGPLVFDGHNTEGDAVIRVSRARKESEAASTDHRLIISDRYVLFRNIHFKGSHVNLIQISRKAHVIITGCTLEAEDAEEGYTNTAKELRFFDVYDGSNLTVSGNIKFINSTNNKLQLIIYAARFLLLNLLIRR